MSDDDLLRALGRLAREQQREAPAFHLAAGAEARTVERALAALGAAPAMTGRRSRRRWAVAAVLLGPAAVAAAILLAAGHPAALPPYALEASAAAATREPAWEAGGPLLLTGGVRVELRLRPAQAVHGPVEARAYWVAGGQVRRWPVEPEIATEGAVRFTGPAEAPFGPGDGEVVVVVARPGALAADGDLAAAPGRQLLRRPVRWR